MTSQATPRDHHPSRQRGKVLGTECQNSHYCGHGMMVCLGPMFGYGRHR
jgi:hypothetical protein